MVCALRDRRPPQGPCRGVASERNEAMATKMRETCASIDAAIAADPYAVPPEAPRDVGF
jgi:hypothetical protein